MTLIWESILEALTLILRLDAQVFEAAGRSLFVSCVAVLLASIIGIPFGLCLARRRFPFRGLVIILCRAGMALPTVFIGLMCYALLSRRGPLGPLDMLYTPWAIILGELLLALPLIVSLTHGAVSGLSPLVAETARTLGAQAVRRSMTYLSEARVGVMLATLTAFSRCVTELGIAMMVGGNIQGRTRTLATATALETGKGEFARGMAMGLILLLMAVGVTSLVVWIGRERDK